MAALEQDTLQQLHIAPHSYREERLAKHPANELIISTLNQVAISRHVRLVFMPTVTHLQAWLSVFDPNDSPIPIPPTPVSKSTPTDFGAPKQSPLLFVYGFLELHRETSEWSAQGIGNSAATLIEAAHKAKFCTTVVEPLLYDETGEVRVLERLLNEQIPVLSGATRRAINDKGRWTSRTAPVKRTLRRWFTVQKGEWDDTRAEVVALPSQQENNILLSHQNSGDDMENYDDVLYEEDEVDENLEDEEQASDILMELDDRHSAGKFEEQDWIFGEYHREETSI